ncbi:PREDICTED: relaxin-3 receptor 2 [Odobenus rosmarus divergens]|uniref:Relaxin-3 receptor 2 n=1 Tax=Odobenus rosmarus divergens TaxID=9708 RepID=A0A9B0LSJ7_ODORO
MSSEIRGEEPFLRTGVHRPALLSPRPLRRCPGTSSHAWRRPCPAAHGLGQRLGGGVRSASNGHAVLSVPSPEGGGRPGRWACGGGRLAGKPGRALAAGHLCSGSSWLGQTEGLALTVPFWAAASTRDFHWLFGGALREVVLRASIFHVDAGIFLTPAKCCRIPVVAVAVGPDSHLSSRPAWPPRKCGRVGAVFRAQGEVWGMHLCLLHFPRQVPTTENGTGLHGALGAITPPAAGLRGPLCLYPEASSSFRGSPNQVVTGWSVLVTFDRMPWDSIFLHHP